VVTDLLLPRQTGTSDTCSATHEEDIFAYQNDHNLLTLGWIHVRRASLPPCLCPHGPS
jgi:STAM-binding protein